jgi:hypothetical protein
MSNHGLFVGVYALALALVANMARCSLISAARRAMAKRWYSVVALVSSLGSNSQCSDEGLYRSGA